MTMVSKEEEVERFLGVDLYAVTAREGAAAGEIAYFLLDVMVAWDWEEDEEECGTWEGGL